MGLGVAAIVGDILPGIFGVARPAIHENIGATFWFYLMVFVFILSIAALVVSINGLGKGERSWGLWAGFIPAVLIISFYLLRFVGGFDLPY